MFFVFKVHKSLQRIRERKLAEFIPWGPASIQVKDKQGIAKTRNQKISRFPFTLSSLQKNETAYIYIHDGSAF